MEDREERLYKEMEPTIRDIASYACYMVYKLPSKYLEDIESITRLAFVKALRSYDTSKGASFNTFFQTIARRDIDKEIKKILNVSFIPASFEEGYMKESPDLIETLSDIEKYVLSLTTNCQSYLRLGAKALLLNAEGYTFEEIARMLDVSSGTLSNYYHRTKEYIKENYSL